MRPHDPFPPFFEEAPEVDDDHVLSKPWELWWLYVPGAARKPTRPRRSRAFRDQ